MSEGDYELKKLGSIVLSIDNSPGHLELLR